MQGSSLKPHYNYSSSLRGQQIPEDEMLDYNYQSSDSSSSSLEDNGESYGIQYPTENLGTSWGSYLHSGPPTRAGIAGAQKRSLRDALNAEYEQRGVQGISVRKNKPRVVLVEPETEVRSVVDTTQPTATSTPKPTSAKQSDSKVTNKFSTMVTLKNSLLKELKQLTETVQSSEQAIAANGFNSDQLKALLNTAQKAYSVLEQQAGEPDNDTEVLKALVQQSHKLQEDAESIQKTGRQLSRNQDEYFREQCEVQQAIEEATLQLIMERKAFENEMAAKQHDLSLQVPPPKHKKGKPPQKPLGTVHEVMQERNQLTALLRTQKEQSKLEKLLLRQQRDIQHLQRDLDSSKAELLSAQDHALKLEHKLLTHGRKALPGQSKRGKRRNMLKGGDSGWQGILTAHKALDREILRVQRQLEEQQLKEQLVSKKLETSSQSLKRGALSLKQQAASIKGKPFHVPKGKLDYGNKPYEVPTQEQRKTHIPQLPHIVKPPVKQEVKIKERKKPTYAFSKQDLVTLACFSDKEATDGVLEWLEVQGNLLD